MSRDALNWHAVITAQRYYRIVSGLESATREEAMKAYGEGLGEWVGETVQEITGEYEDQPW